MTSVLGHLTGLDFERQYRGWLSCPPGSLFEAPVQETVDKVRSKALRRLSDGLLTLDRTNCQLQRISGTKPDTARPCSSGPTVIVKGSISALRSGTRPSLATRASKSSARSLAIPKERKSSYPLESEQFLILDALGTFFVPLESRSNSMSGKRMLSLPELNSICALAPLSLVCRLFNFRL